jgi:hypothetical protein
MRARLAFMLAVVALSGAASTDAVWAATPAECLVAEPQLEHIFSLPATARAIAAKKLDILVLGAGSSMLPGANGAKYAYPSRLQKALAEALSGVVVNVTTDVSSHRNAAEMVKSLPAALAQSKPALVIWQTGTIDAMQSVDPDQFSQTLDQGINLTRNAGADVVLVNAQYSPRTESMIALGTYTDNMRWVALQHEVPLFNRFGIMRLWSDLGTFNFTTATKKLDMAERVHDCIGRLLAELIVEAAKLGGPHTAGDH